MASGSRGPAGWPSHGEQPGAPSRRVVGVDRHAGVLGRLPQRRGADHPATAADGQLRGRRDRLRDERGVLLRELRGRLLRAGGLPARGRHLRVGGRLLFVPVWREPRGRSGDRLSRHRWMFLRRATLRACRQLLQPRLYERRLRNARLRGARSSLHGRQRLLRWRLHDRQVRGSADVHVPSSRRRLRGGRRLLQQRLRRAFRGWPDAVRAPA
jgi:hypothetical protein